MILWLIETLFFLTVTLRWIRFFSFSDYGPLTTPLFSGSVTDKGLMAVKDVCQNGLWNNRVSWWCRGFQHNRELSVVFVSFGRRKPVSVINFCDYLHLELKKKQNCIFASSGYVCILPHLATRNKMELEANLHVWKSKVENVCRV